MADTCPDLDADRIPGDAPDRIVEAVIDAAFALPPGRSEADVERELAAAVAATSRGAVEAAFATAMRRALPNVGDEIDKAPVVLAALMLLAQDRQLAAVFFAVSALIESERATRRLVAARDLAVDAAAAAVADALEPTIRMLVDVRDCTLRATAAAVADALAPPGGWRDAPIAERENRT